MRQRIALLAVCGLFAAGPAVPSAHAAQPLLPLVGPAALTLPARPATDAAQPTPLTFRLDLPAAGEGLGTDAIDATDATDATDMTDATAGARDADAATGATGFRGGDVTFTVDLSGVAGVAIVREGGAAPVARCAADGARLVCVERAARPGTSLVLDLDVTAEQGAGAGASGTLTVTARAAGVAVAAAVTRVTVGGPDLVVEEMRLKRDPKPGESQPLPLAFANRGTGPASGVVLELTATRGLELTRRYDNCAYRTGPTSTTALCTVDGDFAAGEVYEIAGDSPLDLRAAPYARTELLGYGVTPAGPDRTGRSDADRPAHGGHATGRTLTLVRRAAPVAPGALAPPGRASRGATPAARADRREFAFAVENAADLAVEPLSVRGAAGSRVRAAVVLRNHGPAWVFDPRPGAAAAVVDVRVPPGLRVTRVPAGCRVVPGRGPARLLCATGPSVRESERVEFVLELRVEQVVPNAQGAVVAGGPGPRGEPRRPVLDPYPANNAALFLANATGTAVGPGPGAPVAIPDPWVSQDPTDDPGARARTTAAGGLGDEGPLAPTGSIAGLLGFGGAALVAAGGALCVVFQRRRAGRG
ncbi:hypothetical protein [Streptomyces sp. NPDC001568]|uniref:hypothetical protein n=1 Tax=Streptomyces sp. NPDC001568 TaxID=3364588 RepID=UPI00369EE998